MGADIDIGVTGAGAPVMIDLEELLATRLLVQGNSGSGKSHLLRRLLEQSAGLVQQIVIDPEGDYTSLAEHFGHLVIDAAECVHELATIGERVRRHRVSAVLDLEGLEVDDQLRAAAAFMNALFDVDRDYWFPVLVIVDEAQLFAPAAAADASDEARRVSLAAMTNLMCRGRKRGLAGVIATQRLAKLAKNVAAEASNFMMGRTFLDIDMARAADLLGMERRQAESFRDLQRGSFIGLGPAIARRPAAVRIGSVTTADRGHAPALLPLPDAPAPEALQDLIFAPRDMDPVPAPRRPRPDRAADILDRVERAAPAPYVPVPVPELSHSEREAVIDDIIAQMLVDPAAIAQPLPQQHRDFLARCRIRRLGLDVPDLRAFRSRTLALRARMAFPECAEEDIWARAIEVSERLPADLQGVFLLLCRAAATASPCPADDSIAQFFGSHSPARARRILSQLEQIEAIVLRESPQGVRIVAVPDLERETAEPQALALE
jgi:hypothetical protein